RGIKCMLLRTCDAPDETAKKFVVLVWHSVKVSISSRLALLTAFPCLASGYEPGGESPQQSFPPLFSRDTRVTLAYGLSPMSLSGHSAIDSLFSDGDVSPSPSKSVRAATWCSRPTGLIGRITLPRETSK